MLLQPLYPLKKQSVELKRDLAELLLEAIRDYEEEEEFNSRDHLIRKSILVEVHNCIAKKLNNSSKLELKVNLKTHEAIAFYAFLMAQECHHSYRLSMDQLAAQIDQKL